MPFSNSSNVHITRHPGDRLGVFTTTLIVAASVAIGCTLAFDRVLPTLVVLAGLFIVTQITLARRMAAGLTAATSLIAWTVPSTVIAIQGPGLLPLDTRPAVAALIFIGVLAGNLKDDRPAIAADDSNWLNLGFYVLVVFAFASTIWSTDIGQVAGASAGLALAISLSLYTSTALTLYATRPIMVIERFAASVSLLTASLVLVPSISILNGRFRAFFISSNGLGATLGLMVPVALLSRSWGVRSAGFVGLISLVASQSRAGLLAAVVGTSFAAACQLQRWQRSLLLTVLPILFLLGAYLTFTSGFDAGDAPEVGLLRTNDSRSEYWLAALDRISESPLLGSGLGSHDEVFTVNSFLLLASELGTFGVGLAAFLTYHALNAASRTVHAGVRGAIIAGLVSALFESWMFRGGTLYFVLFWSIVLIALRSRDSPSLE